MQTAIRTLIKSYCDTLDAQVIEMADHLDDLLHNRGDSAVKLACSLDIVHQIAGVSGSMGYPDVSLEAAKLEKYIRGFEIAGTRPDVAELAHMADLFAAMQGLTDAVTPQASALYDTDFSRIPTQETTATPRFVRHAKK